jgi:diguanylate cyclase (GGDEF)-like protein
VHSWSSICDENFRHAGLVAALLGIPFVAGNILDGFAAADLVSGGLVLLLLSDAAWRGARHRRLFHPSLLLALAGVVLCWLVFRSGAAAAFWAIPLIFAFHFTLDARPAAALNILVLAGLLPSLLLVPVPAQSVTVAIALLLSSVFAWFFASIVRRHLLALEQQVATDALTGAYNRRWFLVRLAEEVERRKRHGHPASLILFDVDHFKSFNDSFGHDVGDRVLRILIETVKARVRITDEVFRYGGEEFVILLPDTRIEAAMKLAQDVTDMIAKVRMIEGGPVTISCGVGELQAEEEARDWVKRCDLALYHAKDEGRGRVCRAPATLGDPESGGILKLDPPASYKAR